MEVLGLLRPAHDLHDQEDMIKEYCSKNGLKPYITILHGTDELTFVEDHKTLVFSSPAVLNEKESEVIMDYASKNKIAVHFAK